MPKYAWPYCSDCGWRVDSPWSRGWCVWCRLGTRLMRKEHMKNKYIDAECDKCGVAILVRENDNAPRYYCYPCAMSKLGETP